METPSFLENRRFPLLLFGGKGGVGKTTCAAAAGFYLADQFPDSSFLLVSTDPAHSLLDSLAGDRPPDNLTVLEIDAQHCLESFKTKYGAGLRAIASRGTFLDDQDIIRLLDLSLPGLDEVMALLQISQWVQERRYDSVLVDTAPSGHTLRLLQVPELINKWMDVLDALLAKHRYMRQVFGRSDQRDALDDFLEELAESVAAIGLVLRDPVSCRFITVTLAEVMSVRETLDLIRELKRLNMPITDVIINRLYPAGTCPSCRAEHASQTAALGEFFLNPGMNQYSIWGIPMYPVEVRGQQALRSFWQRMVRTEGPCSALADLSSPAQDRPVRVAEPAPVPDRAAYAAEPPPGTRFFLFGGKGGVGKTTFSCATAIWIAREYPGKRVLLLSTDPAHSLSDCLDFEVGPTPTVVFPGLTAMELDSQAEFEALKAEYAADLKRLISGASRHFELPFDQQVMDGILDLAPPGLDEVMALSRVTELLASSGYDVLVLDSASTGHLIRLLELPELVNRWLLLFFDLILKYRKIFRMPGFSQRLVEFSKCLRKLRKLLIDRTTALLYVVSIPTEMAFEETRDLMSACRRLGVHVPAMFLNMTTPEAACDFCLALRERESRVLRRLRESFADIEIKTIYRQDNLRGLTQLGEFAGRLYQLPRKESTEHAL